MFGPIYIVLNTSDLFFYLFNLIELDILLVAYCDELLVAKSSNMLLVAKSWTIELSVVKDDVRRCLHITTASLATARIRRYNL
jgi:hypothetical protein